MIEKDLKFIIINNDGIISFDNINNIEKSLHIFALRLACIGNVIMTNQCDAFHKSNVNIYLPDIINESQYSYINYINSFINNYRHITLYNDIRNENGIFHSRVMSSDITNYDINDCLVNKNKVKKKIK